MRVQASLPPHAQAQADVAVLPEELLEAAIRAVTQAFYGPRPQPTVPATRRDGGRPDLPPLLAPQQAADLIGVSRNTIDRMVDDGELPSIVLREGTRQRMVRVPKSFVLQMLSDLESGAHIRLREYTAQWTASATQPPTTTQGELLEAAEVA